MDRGIFAFGGVTGALALGATEISSESDSGGEGAGGLLYREGGFVLTRGVGGLVCDTGDGCGRAFEEGSFARFPRRSGAACWFSDRTSVRAFTSEGVTGGESLTTAFLGVVSENAGILTLAGHRHEDVVDDC